MVKVTPFNKSYYSNYNIYFHIDDMTPILVGVLVPAAVVITVGIIIGIILVIYFNIKDDKDDKGANEYVIKYYQHQFQSFGIGISPMSPGISPWCINTYAN